MTHEAYDQVAQPEDHIPQRDLWLKIGPYDYWAIAWAYKAIPGSTTPESEQPTLMRWRRAQDTAAYLRDMAGGSRGNDDSGQQWGGQDLAKAVGLKNRNVARFWTRVHTNADDRATLFGTSSYDLANTIVLDQTLIKAWQYRLRLVASLLGGRAPRPPYPRALDSVQMVPVSTARQLQALRFVLGTALYGQDPMIKAWQQWQPKETRATLNSDSLPILFDTTLGPEAEVAASWVDAQRDVLSYVMTRVPQMPLAAHPAVCRDFTAAVHDLTTLESQVPPPSAAEADSLRITLSAWCTSTKGIGMHDGSP
jgi:hypothetical protein